MRKPAQVLYTLDDYIRDGSLEKTHAQVLREALDRRLNIVVAGGTGSGKTTLAGAMINEMVERSDPNESYVIIEDTLEIQCRAQNLVQLHTAESADMTRLVRTTMRLRPDRIIIGEVRGAEALALLKAWNAGHPGGVTTIHANSARAALTRLSSLVQEAGVPPQPELIAETINPLVFIVRTPAGRRVTERVRPFTALTAVERLAVSSNEPTWVAASLPVFRSMTCACADWLPSQRSLAMTSRMPETSVSLSRTSWTERSKC